MIAMTAATTSAKAPFKQALLDFLSDNGLDQGIWMQAGQSAGQRLSEPVIDLMMASEAALFQVVNLFWQSKDLAYLFDSFNELLDSYGYIPEYSQPWTIRLHRA